MERRLSHPYLLKTDSKSLVSKYWGISLIDVLSKLLERQVYIEVLGATSPNIT